MPDPTNKEMIDRLDEIALHLKHMDSRDRMRMIGGTIRSLINIGFLVFAIWSSWYLLYHLSDIIKTVSEETARATMQYGKAGSTDFLKQMQDLLKK